MNIIAKLTVKFVPVVPAKMELRPLLDECRSEKCYKWKRQSIAILCNANDQRDQCMYCRVQLDDSAERARPATRFAEVMPTGWPREKTFKWYLAVHKEFSDINIGSKTKSKISLVALRIYDRTYAYK